MIFFFPKYCLDLHLEPSVRLLIKSFREKETGKIPRMAISLICGFAGQISENREQSMCIYEHSSLKLFTAALREELS